MANGWNQRHGAIIRGEYRSICGKGRVVGIRVASVSSVVYLSDIRLDRSRSSDTPTALARHFAILCVRNWTLRNNGLVRNTRWHCLGPVLDGRYPTPKVSAPTSHDYGSGSYFCYCLHVFLRFLQGRGP